MVYSMQEFRWIDQIQSIMKCSFNWKLFIVDLVWWKRFDHENFACSFITRQQSLTTDNCEFYVQNTIRFILRAATEIYLNRLLAIALASL